MREEIRDTGKPSRPIGHAWPLRTNHDLRYGLEITVFGSCAPWNGVELASRFCYSRPRFGWTGTFSHSTRNMDRSSEHFLPLVVLGGELAVP